MSWNQIGLDIDGQAYNAQSGYSISLSSDGNIVAIGAPGNNDFKGQVKVYQYQNSNWTQIGQDINGDNRGFSGYSVSLSSDGMTLAVGAPFDNNEIGVVKVYNYVTPLGGTPGTWKQFGKDLIGEDINNRFGWSLSLSANGSILAIGAPSNWSNRYKNSKVIVYKYSSNNWTQIGKFNGETDLTYDLGDSCGSCVSLSANGTLLAIGYPVNCQNAEASGKVIVYQNINDGNWSQIGGVIYGETQYEYLGSTFFLSANGSILAIGCANRNRVRVYQYNTNTWSQIGKDINGEGQTGWSVSLSANGSILAVSSIGVNNANGQVKVYKYNSNTWSQIGENINGEGQDGQYFGYSVSLSENGSSVAISAPYYDANGIQDSGKVKIYKTKVVPSLGPFTVPEKNYGDPNFPITPPTSDSPGAFYYNSSNTSIATITGNIVKIIATGNTEITVTQAAIDNFTSATTSTIFQVIKSNPIIGTFSVSEKKYGDPAFTLTPPTSNSNGLFSYLSSNTSVATIIGNLVTIVGVGSSQITAIQQETPQYNSATTSATLKVNKANPIFGRFTVPTPRTYGDNSFTLTPPTSNSDGLFTYKSSNISVAIIIGTQLTIVGAGNSNITATQEATNIYNPKFVTTQLQVNKAIPTFGVFTVPTKTILDSAFTITPPTSNSNGLFSYLSSNTSVATITGNLVKIVGVGISQITAIQSMVTNYNSATITTTFQVVKLTPTFGEFTVPPRTYGDGSFTITPPTSNSDGIFSYLSSDNSVATVFGDQVKIKGAGSSHITAIQAETSIYASGTKTTIFQVNKVNPIIGTFSIPEKIFGDIDFTITHPTSNSPGSFNYTSSDTSVATILGTTVTIIGAGTTLIKATQEETQNFNSGSIDTIFQVNKAIPIISNFFIPANTFGGDTPVTPFQITQPTSNSNGDFTYSSFDTLVATISEDVVTINGPGSSQIIATQAETSNFFSGTTSTIFIVIQIVNTPQGLINFMDTELTYGIISDSFKLNEDLSSSSTKLLFVDNNDTKITKNTG